MIENRRAGRVGIIRKMSIKPEKQALRMGLTCNVSETGAYLLLPANSTLTCGQRLVMTIVDSILPAVDVKARIVRLDTAGIGVIFD